MPTKVLRENAVNQFPVPTAKRCLDLFRHVHLVLLVLLAGPAYTADFQERQLQDCRARAARDARTEAGAKAMLADCAKRFPVPQPTAPSAPTDEDCRRKGLVRIELFGEATCGADHQNRPCTEQEFAEWKAAEVSPAVCKRRGDTWSEKAKLCFKKGHFFGPTVCKR
jgi:hypothetical protein